MGGDQPVSLLVIEHSGEQIVVAECVLALSGTRDRGIVTTVDKGSQAGLGPDIVRGCCGPAGTQAFTLWLLPFVKQSHPLILWGLS